MKFPYLISLLSAGLFGSTDAKFMENDVLAAQGMRKLRTHLAKNGLPSPGTCTLDTASVRREW
jgi:tyrosinase